MSSAAPFFDIALFQPCIPQNTGNIGRLCVNTGSRLRLIKPLGFSLDEKYVRRAGLDYWRFLDLTIHENWDAFVREVPEDNMFFFSTKATRSFWDCPYPKGAVLVFGNEPSGFSQNIYATRGARMYGIPMPGEGARSLNLANAVAVVLYEGLRRYLHSAENAGT